MWETWRNLNNNPDEDAKVNGSFNSPQIVILLYPCDTKNPIKNELKAFESDWYIDVEDADPDDRGDMQ